MPTQVGVLVLVRAVRQEGEPGRSVVPAPEAASVRRAVPAAEVAVPAGVRVLTVVTARAAVRV